MCTKAASLDWRRRQATRRPDAFTVGVAVAVSETAVANPPIREVASEHALLSGGRRASLSPWELRTAGQWRPPGLSCARISPAGNFELWTLA